MAKGEYIGFVDGDDWIEDNMYRELLYIMENKKVDFVNSGYITRKNKINSIKRMKPFFYELDNDVKHQLYSALLGIDVSTYMNPSIWSKIFKTELIKKCYSMVPDNQSYGEDVISVIHCISAAKAICQVKEAYYHYTYRNDSISHIKEFERVNQVFGLWELCGKIVLDYDQLMDKRIISKVIFNQLRVLFASWNTDEIDLLQCYVFPGIEMLYDKKIVIYGAGLVGVDYVKQISRNERCNIICWVDKEYSKYHYEYRKVEDVKKITNVYFDLILVAVRNKELAKEIESDLEEMGISLNKIIWQEPKRQF